MPNIDIDTKTPDAIWQGTVIIFQGTRYIVEKVNPKNWRIQDANGSTYNLNRGARGAKRAADQEWEGKKVDEYSVALDRFQQLTLKPGAVVRFTRAQDRQKFPGLYVITNVGPKNYRAHLLGGEGTNRYVTTSPNLVESVPGVWSPHNS